MGKDAEREQLEERLGRYLKGSLKQADLTYEELAERLESLGFSETKASIASKLGRGSFSASFMVATLRAIGKETISLNDFS